MNTDIRDSDHSKQLTYILFLLATNVVAMVVVAGALIFGLLPKIERAIQAVERVEDRFQSFADEVQPVVTAGAGKAIETIQKMDATKLSETATEKTDTILEAAGERAKRFLDRDKSTKD